MPPIPSVLFVCVFAAAPADGGAWVFETREEGPAFPAQFGSALAVASGRLAAGAPGDGPGGSVTIVDETTGDVRVVAETSSGAEFGAALAWLDGGLLAAGAPGRDGTAGAVTLVPADGAADPVLLPSPDSARARFGATLASAGGTLLVGAVGRTGTRPAVFAFHDGGGRLVATFESPAATAEDDFGVAVAMGDGAVVVGAPGTTIDDAVDAGAVFLFDSVSGAVLDVLSAPEPQAGARFGAAVAVHGPRIVVGAPGENGDAGAAYVFDGPAPAPPRRLAPSPVAVGRFGAAVARGPVIAVGAPNVRWGVPAVTTGAVSLFDSTTGAFLQALVDPAPTAAAFGTALAFGDGGGLAVASPLRGVVSRFGTRCGPCPPCGACDASGTCVAAAGCEAEIWCMGDSVTARYAPVLAERAPTWTIRNFGLGGEASNGGLGRLPLLLDEVGSLPDVVIVLYGTNDLTLGNGLGLDPATTAEGAAQRVAQMVALLTERNVTPLVALPIDVPRPLVDVEMERYALGFATLRQLERSMRPTVDFRLRASRMFDGLVHPSDSGARLLASRARHAVRRALRARARAAATAFAH